MSDFNPLSLLASPISGAFQIAGASKQANAMKQAAQIQADAATHVADLQNQATAQALAFTKQQAENSYQNAEAARAANYGQWAAGQARLGTLGQLLGLGPRDIPAYVPGIDPNFTGSGGTNTAPTAGSAPLTSTTTTPTSTTGLPAGGTSQSFGNLTDPSTWMGLVGNPSQLSSWVKSVAPSMSPDLVNYYVGKIQGQPGANPTEQAGSAAYWAQKIANDPTLTGRSSSAGSSTQGSQLPSVSGPGTLGSYLMPMATVPTTPGLTMPTPYTAQPLGAYLGA